MKIPNTIAMTNHHITYTLMIHWLRLRTYMVTKPSGLGTIIPQPLTDCLPDGSLSAV